MKIEQILERQPEILLFYGIEIEDAQKAVKEWKDSQKEENKEDPIDLSSQNKELWKAWLIQYL